MRRAAVHALIIGTAALLLGGCAVLGYYKQSIGGHLDLMQRAESIDQLVASESIAPELRARLQTLQAIRHFAISELELPDNGSYLKYADLDRAFTVWNVFAAPEFSLDPVKTCFPVVGCLSYRGYFSEAAAHRAAQKLVDRGHDVYVGGVAAYSTLGWFADPVVSPMLRWSDTRLAQLVFHELAHQRVYVDDDSDFNEAFATAVSEIGVERWLASSGNPQAMAEWQAHRVRQQDFLILVSKTAGRLRRLYRIQADAGAKRAAKAEILHDMRNEYHQLREGKWAGYDGYDHWFATVNNARMAAVATYHDRVPAFVRLYESLGADLSAFYAACDNAAALSKTERAAFLQRLTEKD